MKYDVIIIGGGPAGLTSGLYCARAGLKTLLVEMGMPGGQAASTDWVENYPGFPEGISGIELMQKFVDQALKFGLEIANTHVHQVDFKEEEKVISTDQGEYRCKAVIIATGAHWKNLEVPGEERLRGMGVSYCATCDGAFFKNKKLVVVGGGNSSLEEALFLTKFASEVVIVHRREEFRATKVVEDRAKNHPKISFVLNTVVKEIMGENKVEKVLLENVKTGETREEACDGVFIFVGTEPNSDFLREYLRSDEKGYILGETNLSTSQIGVFVAGDVRKKEYKQISTAVGDGTIAAMSAEKYIAARE